MSEDVGSPDQDNPSPAAVPAQSAAPAAPVAATPPADASGTAQAAPPAEDAPAPDPVLDPATLPTCLLSSLDPDVVSKLGYSSPPDAQAATTVYRVYASGAQIYKSKDGTWQNTSRPSALLFPAADSNQLIGEHTSSPDGPLWRFYDEKGFDSGTYVVGNIKGKEVLSTSATNIDELRMPATGYGRLKDVHRVCRLFTMNGKPQGTPADNDNPLAPILGEYNASYTCEYYFLV